MEKTSLESGITVIKETIKTLPKTPGVYRMLDQKGNVLYVGKAKNLPNRINSYTMPDKLPIRLQRMVASTHTMITVPTQTEVEALLLENNLIKKFKPPYNVLLKDDKSYPYILITQNHDYPRIVKHRGAKSIKGDYFGPFANVAAVDEAILSLQRIFMIRSCKDTFFAQRSRPCLQYHIKRCSAPCVNKISNTDYQESIENSKDFLKGKTSIVQNVFIQKMQEASDTLNFEQAAKYRDQIKLLTAVQEKQRIEIQDVDHADVIALYREKNHTVVQVIFFRHSKNYGSKSIFLTNLLSQNEDECLNIFLNQFYTEHEPPEYILLSHTPSDFALTKDALKELYKRSIKWEIPKMGVKRELIDHAIMNAKHALTQKMLSKDNMQRIFDDLQKTFDLKDMPERIEAYDNSHFQGSNPVGVMVVVTPDGFDKKAYRKFNIKQKRDFGGDDFAMMKEVLSRRFSHENDWGLPDLLLIDGGVGQVNIVKQVLKENNLTIPIVGIAKGEDRNAGKEHFIIETREPFQLPFNSPLLYFLQQLRDESHRFAITTHRNKRIKNLSNSTLDDIPNIGKLRKKILLQHFGSLELVKQANLESLMNVKGISHHLAKQIFDFFH